MVVIYLIAWLKQGWRATALFTPTAVVSILPIPNSLTIFYPLRKIAVVTLVKTTLALICPIYFAPKKCLRRLWLQFTIFILSSIWLKPLAKKFWKGNKKDTILITQDNFFIKSDIIYLCQKSLLGYCAVDHQANTKYRYKPAPAF